MTHRKWQNGKKSESEIEMGHGDVSNLVSLSSAGAGGGPLDDVNFTRIILKLRKIFQEDVQNYHGLSRPWFID